MSTLPAPVPVPFPDIERELDRQLKHLQSDEEAPLQRARLSNLIIYCDDRSLGNGVAVQVPEIVLAHPSRVLLLVRETTETADELTATVLVREKKISPTIGVCAEQVTITAAGSALDRLPFAVRRLLIGDLPTNLWWASIQPPALAGSLVWDLSEYAEQVVYDSLGWREPARGVAATAPWMDKFGSARAGARRRIASDLQWRRLKPWRRIVSQVLDPAVAPGAIASLSAVTIDHGPHAVVQAWQLVAWIAARLGWKVERGRARGGAELDWVLASAHGPVHVAIRRQPAGPAEIHSLTLACKLDGKSAELKVASDGAGHLAATVPGPNTVARTTSAPSLSLAELVSRQLSDRDRDPVFEETMRIARVFAQGLV